MVTSGVEESFTHNIRKVAADIIHVARRKTSFKKGMKKYLDLLETSEGVHKPSESKSPSLVHDFEQGIGKYVINRLLS